MLAKTWKVCLESGVDIGMSTNNMELFISQCNNCFGNTISCQPIDVQQSTSIRYKSREK